VLGDTLIFPGGLMSYRSSVSKSRSSRQFRGNSSRTKGVNIAQAPQRGGWRL